MNFKVKIIEKITSNTGNVVAYDYDITTGHITNKKVVINIPKEDGYPDGMTIDTEGMLWIALWGGWKIVRYNPFTGEQLHQISLPVSRVSSCIFGGDTLEDIYITSARARLSEYDLKAQPLSFIRIMAQQELLITLTIINLMGNTY